MLTSFLKEIISIRKIAKKNFSEFPLKKFICIYIFIQYYLHILLDSITKVLVLLVLYTDIASNLLLLPL